MFPIRRSMGEAPATPAASQPDNTTNEQPYKLVYTVALAAGQDIKDARVNIDNDADFLAVSVFGKSTGAFQIQFKDSRGRPLSSAQIDNDLALGTAQLPVPFGGVLYPRAGQLALHITDISGVANTVTVVFDGFKQQ